MENTVYLKVRNEDPLSFLIRTATLIPVEKFAAAEWHQIEKSKVPVMLTQDISTTPPTHNAKILYNKEQFHTYRRLFAETRMENNYFFYITIDLLWEVSNLNDVKHIIESDRVCTKPSTRRFIDSETKSEILRMIHLDMNRSKSPVDIARYWAITVSQVYAMARLLKDKGVPVELKPKEKAIEVKRQTELAAPPTF